MCALSFLLQRVQTVKRAAELSLGDEPPQASGPRVGWEPLATASVLRKLGIIQADSVLEAMRILLMSLGGALRGGGREACDAVFHAVTLHGVWHGRRLLGGLVQHAHISLPSADSRYALFRQEKMSFLPKGPVPDLTSSVLGKARLE